MSSLQNPHVVAVALGATIGVISAASLFIYQKVMEHKERTTMMNNLESVNRRVSQLQVELDNLRSQQNQIRGKKGKGINRKRITSSASIYSAVESDMDGVSVTETDIDDEFYDCSDDEITTLDFELNGTAGVMLELARQLDTLDEKIESKEFHEEVLCDLRQLAIWHEDNVDVAWRLARACFKNATDLSDTTEQDILVLEGMKVCENILELEHMELHKWYALLVGLRSEYLPIKERLKAGKIFETHVKRAVNLAPNDPVLNHLLGRFQYIVTSLSWVERKIAETLFGEVPNATYDAAQEALERAEKYGDKPDLENKYYLGQTYIQLKAYHKGVAVLKQMQDLKATNKKQQKMQKEAASLVSKYLSYC